MKLALHPYSLPLRTPLVTANGVVTHRDGVLVSLVDGDVAGWGDVCPMPGWSAVTVHEAIGAFSSLVGDVNRGLIEETLASLTPAPEIRAGLAGAWLDLRAQHARCSLAEFLHDGSGVVPASLPVHATVAALDVDAAQQAALDAVALGVQALKCKVGFRDPAEEVSLVALLRKSVGPDVELRLDANGGWTTAQALEVLEAMAEHDVAFCEEPAAGLDSLISVAQQSPIPVAIDESATTGAQISAAVDGGVSVVVLKPQAIGGADVAVAVATQARDAGAQLVVTSMIESAVGVAHAAHVAAAIAPLTVHGLATSSLLADDVADHLPVSGGRIQLGSPIGLGVGVPSAS